MEGEVLEGWERWWCSEGKEEWMVAEMEGREESKGGCPEGEEG